MTLDKFGHSLKPYRGSLKGPKGDGYNFTVEGNYDIQNKRLCNVGTSLNNEDAATKGYVDSTCKTELAPLITNIATALAELNSLKDRISKVEGRIEVNKTYHDKQLKKFGVYIFNYINQKHTGRAVSLPQTAEGDYLNWEELFKLPSTINEEKQTEIDIPLPDSVREYILQHKPK